MEEEKKQIENDIAEDERETDESLSNETDDSTTNDIAEDQREESESIEDLKNLLNEALLKNAKLEKEISVLRKDLDEAHKLFMTKPRESEEETRSYQSIRRDIR